MVAYGLICYSMIYDALFHESTSYIALYVVNKIMNTSYSALSKARDVTVMETKY